MSDPTYEKIRAAERAEADARKSAAMAGKAVAQAVEEFLNGKASLSILPNGLGAYLDAYTGGGSGWTIRFNRDTPR